MTKAKDRRNLYETIMDSLVFDRGEIYADYILINLLVFFSAALISAVINLTSLGNYIMQYVISVILIAEILFIINAKQSKSGNREIMETVYQKLIFLWISAMISLLVLGIYIWISNVGFEPLLKGIGWLIQFITITSVVLLIILIYFSLNHWISNRIN